MTTIRLAPGQTAIVGYGSLISRASVEKTLKHRYDGFFGACHIEGWRRSWDIGMPNGGYYFVEDGRRLYPERILYLNVRPVPGALLNVVVLVVDAGELTAMHQREWIYDARVVTASLRGVVIEGGDAVMYVARPEYVVHDATDARVAAVRASYLRIVDEGLQRMADSFRAEYEQTTDPVPPQLVIDDVLDADRSARAARPAART